MAHFKYVLGKLFPPVLQTLSKQSLVNALLHKLLHFITWHDPFCLRVCFCFCSVLFAFFSSQQNKKMRKRVPSPPLVDAPRPHPWTLELHILKIETKNKHET